VLSDCAKLVLRDHILWPLKLDTVAHFQKYRHVPCESQSFSAIPSLKSSPWVCLM